MRMLALIACLGLIALGLSCWAMEMVWLWHEPLVTWAAGFEESWAWVVGLVPLIAGTAGLAVLASVDRLATALSEAAAQVVAGRRAGPSGATEEAGLPSVPES